jgi:PRC-barrel domain protein
VDHPYPWLKYLPAKNLDDQEVDFAGMKVESPSAEDLGKVEGFVVDSESGRPYYVVVDAGGWFKSKHFLLPVGHVRFDPDRKWLSADLTKERGERLPGFDLSKFDKMSADDLKRLNVETLQACTIAGAVYAYSETEPYTAAWDRVDFSYPDWWSGQHPSERKSERPGAKAEVGSGMPPAESIDQTNPERERVAAHDKE